jgi:hypothetical protein
VRGEEHDRVLADLAEHSPRPIVRSTRSPAPSIMLCNDKLGARPGNDELWSRVLG